MIEPPALITLLPSLQDPLPYERLWGIYEEGLIDALIGFLFALIVICVRHQFSSKWFYSHVEKEYP